MHIRDFILADGEVDSHQMAQAALGPIPEQLLMWFRARKIVPDSLSSFLGTPGENALADVACKKHLFLFSSFSLNFFWFFPPEGDAVAASTFDGPDDEQ